MRCLNHTYCQILAREFASFGTRRYIIKMPGRTSACLEVQLQPYVETRIRRSTEPQKEAGFTPRLAGPVVDNEQLEKLRSSAWTKQSANKYRLLKTLLDTLRKLRFYRGTLQMRAHLGTFVLTSYRNVKDNTYEFGEFVDMMKQHQVRGHVTEEYADSVVVEILVLTQWLGLVTWGWRSSC